MKTPFAHSLLAAVPLWLGASLSGSADVVINEIHFAPMLNNEASDFIELHNAGASAVDLSGWQFTDGFSYTFPEGSTIDPEGYWVLAENATTYNRKFGSIFANGRKADGAFESGQLADGGEEITLRNAADEVVDRVDFEDRFPWPVAAGGDGPSMELIHPSLDNDLGGSWRSSIAPTPGERNSIYAETAPPHIRQVDHAPKSPLPGDDVIVTAKVTDPEGVGSVTLRYQLVTPGNYIDLTDDAFLTDWTTLPMEDDGGGTDTFTGTLPGDLQKHRHLIRYQIRVEDSEGTAITVPYPDDGQPNFAYYCYGDMPAWTGAVEPGETEPVTYEPELLQSIPVYQLLTKKESHVEAQHIIGSSRGSGYTGDDYQWKGTLVYDGDVYDHISYRARGGVWRYAMGKNMWKFLFNRSHEFQARNPLGEKYPVKWRRLNFSAIIQQGNFNHRGEQGLFESVGFALFDKAGIEAPNTHYVHFRIVENTGESNIFGNQYNTDFQGLYLAIEQLDGRFMRTHGLPEGNLYKMEDGTGEKGLNGELKNLGPYPMTDDYSDLEAFKKLGYERGPDPEWYRENMDLPRYYAYRSIVEAIHHYDIGGGKNYYYYHNPVSGKWATLPWDLDLTWDDNMFGPGTEPFQRRVAETDPFEQEYHNKLREVLDLLYNPEQTGLLIEEKASAVYTPGEPSFVDADRAMWDHNPILASRYVNPSKAGHGRFYRVAATDDFPGMMTRMNAYVMSRSDWIKRNVLKSTESLIPQPPTVTLIGDDAYRVDDLVFESSAFKGGSIFAPQTFGGMKWRLAEITDVTADHFSPEPPNQYEIDPVWESDVLTEFQNSITIPTEVVRPGRVYRVRARMQNTNGYWSHWSEPIQFVAGQPDLEPYLQGLVISEILYAPAEATDAERLASFETADFEFIELLNLGDTALDLSHVRFTKGIDYDFSLATQTMIAPGERLVLARHRAAFESRYGMDLPVIGEYGSVSGSKLDNNGERLKLSFGAGIAIRDLDYDNGKGWPELEKGTSLNLVETSAVSDHALASHWGAGSQPGGTPGTADDAITTTPTGGDAGFAAWQAARFSAEALADASVSGPLADPDANGLVNLQEYAFSGILPELVQWKDGPAIAIKWSESIKDITYLLEHSDDLQEWTPQAVSIALDGNTGYFPLDAATGFWRVVTTLK